MNIRGVESNQCWLHATIMDFFPQYGKWAEAQNIFFFFGYHRLK